MGHSRSWDTGDAGPMGAMAVAPLLADLISEDRQAVSSVLAVVLTSADQDPVHRQNWIVRVLSQTYAVVVAMTTLHRFFLVIFPVRALSSEHLPKYIPEPALALLLLRSLIGALWR